MASAPAFSHLGSELFEASLIMSRHQSAHSNTTLWVRTVSTHRRPSEHVIHVFTHKHSLGVMSTEIIREGGLPVVVVALISCCSCDPHRCGLNTSWCEFSERFVISDVTIALILESYCLDRQWKIRTAGPLQSRCPFSLRRESSSPSPVREISV